MSKPTLELKHIVEQTKELEKIETFRLGVITKVDTVGGQIWVEYDGNPYREPLVAKLGTPWLTIDKLIQFIDRVDSVKLDFLEGDPAKPVIRDLFYSLDEINRSGSDPLTDKKIEIVADEIILRGKTKIIIECGDARTIYLAEGNEIIEEADQIDSSANKNNRMKGGKILLN